MLYCRIGWKTEDYLGSLTESKVVGIQVEKNSENNLEGRNAFNVMNQGHWENGKLKEIEN